MDERVVRGRLSRIPANPAGGAGRYLGAKASPTHPLMSSVRSILGPAVALLSALVLGGCTLLSKSTTTSAASTPTTLMVVQGNGQSAQAGKALPGAIVLRIVDENGRGVAKQVATLLVASGGGTVNPATVVSDSSGEMKLNWVLGTASPAQTLSATVNGTIGVGVAATAIFPAQIVVAQGQLQTGKVATVLKNDIVIRVVGPSNQPMSAVPVTFTVTEGGGGISPQSGVTNALGEFTTKWTLGAAAGANSLVATVGELQKANVKAIAIP